MFWMLVELFLVVSYFSGLFWGLYHIFWIGDAQLWMVGTTIICSWLSGMQWGELVEKIQHIFHVSKLLRGSQH